MNKMRDDPYQIQKLDIESQGQAVELQELMFEVTRRRIKGPGSPYFFIATRELRSELHYGFISNVQYSSLKNLVTTENQDIKNIRATKDLISWFRDQFIGEFEPEGLLRNASQVLKKIAVTAGEMMVFTISESGAITSTNYYTERGAKKKFVPPKILEGIEGNKNVNEKFVNHLKKFRSCVDEKLSSDLFHIAIRVNTSKHKSSEVRRQLPEFIQLALIYNPNTQICLSDSFVHVLHQWMDASSISAYSVFYERERYFSKALRQSAQGTIIKWGEGNSINNQRKLLQKLNNPNPIHAAPVVLSYDSNREPGKVSWYKMPKYTMPLMLDQMVSTEGFSDYEVISLGRACFEHLEKYFWKGTRIVPIPEAAFGVKPSLLSALSISIHSVDNAKKIIVQRWDSVKKNEPVKISDRVVIKPDVASREKLYAFVKGQVNSISLSLKLDPSQTKAIKFKLRQPMELLSKLVEHVHGLEDEEYNSPPLILYKRGGCLHGDPHFENLFIDASIPEDPYIVAIDPMEPKYDASLWGKFKNYVGDDTNAEALEAEILELFEFTGKDPGYDVAKLLLSTTGLYSLISTDAFRLEINNNEISIKWLQSKDAQRLVNVGLSNARLVFLGALAVESSWYNHNLVAKTVLGAYIGRIDSHLNGGSKPDSNLTVNVALLRLWLFLLRHIFSVSEKLFPEQLDRSLILYLVGSCLVNRGYRMVNKALNGGLNEPDFSQKFRELLMPQSNLENFE